MSNVVARVLHFDGKLPYAEDGSGESVAQDGGTITVLHAPRVKQGSDFKITLVFPGVDLGDYTFKAEFRTPGAGGTKVLDFGNAAFTVDVDDTKMVMFLAFDAGLEGINTADGEWDLEAVETSGGAKNKWVKGNYEVEKEVTTGA